jgi:hypothetical protein
MKATEVIIAHGHENVRSTNKTTFEITKETHLTKRGNCIIAVDATKGAVDLSQQFKDIARSENAQITIELEVDGEKETVKAWGSPGLTFTHFTDLVVRKSNFVCNRTLAISADKAACNFSNRLVEKLHNPNQKAKITLTAERPT